MCQKYHRSCINSFDAASFIHRREIILIDRAWLSFTPVRSIYIRNCSHHDRVGRPNEIELRIVSTDVSSTAGENRTRVIVSACESSSSCRGSRTAAVDTTDVAPSSRRKCLCPSRPLTANRCAQPFRRRVSFSDSTVIGIDGEDDRCCRTMQDDDIESACRDNDREIESKTERETFYDIWQADISSIGRSDDGYLESTPRIDNYAENRCGVSGCTFNSNKGQRSQSENIGEEQTVESDGLTRRERTAGNGDVCPVDRIAGNKARSNEDNTVWNEELSNSIHKNVDSIGRDEYRMRGGCGGCYCGAAREKWVKYHCCAGTSKFDVRCLQFF